MPSRRPSWNAVIAVAAAVFLGIAVMVIARGNTGPAFATAAEVGAGADLAAPESLFADGQARFYRYTSAAGRTVRFFVMKSADGVLRAAMDACAVCYKAGMGYRQVGDTMVCNKCGQAFQSNRINVATGGCNPIPLDRTVQGGQVVIRAAALEQGAIHY